MNLSGLGWKYKSNFNKKILPQCANTLFVGLSWKFFNGYWRLSRANHEIAWWHENIALAWFFIYILEKQMLFRHHFYTSRSALTFGVIVPWTFIGLTVLTLLISLCYDWRNQKKCFKKGLYMSNLKSEYTRSVSLFRSR